MLLHNDILNTPEGRHYINSIHASPNKVDPDMALSLRNWASIVYKPPISQYQLETAMWRKCPKEIAHFCMSAFSAKLMQCDVMIWDSDVWEEAIYEGANYQQAPFEMKWFNGIKPQLWVWRDEDVEHQPDFLMSMEVIEDTNIIFATWFPLTLQGIRCIVFAYVYSDHMIAVQKKRPVRSPQTRFFIATEGCKISPYYADMIAAFRFLGTNAVDNRNAVTAPKMQKALNKKYKNKPPRIRTIALRKFAPKPQAQASVSIDTATSTEPTTPGSHRDIEWKGSWTVREHQRKQWYPSEKVHKMITVRAYEKNKGAEELTRVFIAKR